MKSLILSTWLLLIFTILTTGCTSKTVTYFNNITLLGKPKKSVENPILQEIAEHLQTETNATLLYPGESSEAKNRLTLFLTDKYLKISFNDLKMFDPEQTILSPTVKEDLGQIAPILKQYPDIIIQIIGHAYEEGKKEKEIRHFADMRAISVAEYLYDQGFKQEILAKGCGDDVPRLHCPKEKPHMLCSSKNRRIEIFIYSNKSDVITRCR